MPAYTTKGIIERCSRCEGRGYFWSRNGRHTCGECRGLGIVYKDDKEGKGKKNE